MPEMKRVARGSIADDFDLEECPIPTTPKFGARIKVHFAGACYSDQQIRNSGQRRLRQPGVQDTSLFPGYEVAGVIDEVCEQGFDVPFKKGDRVVVYPDQDNESCVQDGNFCEFITVCNLKNLIKVPDSLSLTVASQLPCGALMAYATVLRSKPFMEAKLQGEGTVTVLVIGAGGLGLWGLKLAKHFIGASDRVKTVIADTNLEKLNLTKTADNVEVIHWADSMYEETILERTLDVCQGGVDMVVDFVSTPRTIGRALKVLNEEGVLLVGGTAKYEVTFCLNSLAQKSQSIIGVRNGTRQMLKELVDTFACGEITPPVYDVFPVEDATRVFGMLNECKIYGRAVLQMCAEES